jgi:hypothetical protein
MKAAGSIPDGVFEILFYWLDPSGRTMALGSIVFNGIEYQGVKVAGAWG